MDNLQQHYLRLLQGAQKKALAGEFEECLNVCFDLRLKPDLALYTRAQVCITICDLIHTRSLPEKVEMAKDALRIAKELKQEQNSQKNSFWIKTYDNLIQNAEMAVERAEEEQREQDAITDFATHDTEGAHHGEVLEEIEVPPREDNTKIIGMPKIEGAFANYPATMSAAAVAADSTGSGSSDVAMGGESSEAESVESLPFTLPRSLPQRPGRVSSLVQQFDNFQGPTPPTSSRPGSEQPEQGLGNR